MEYKLTQRKGRCVQVMYEGTDKWVSTGCYSKEEAVAKIERDLRLTGTMTLDLYAKDFYNRTDPASIQYRNKIHNKHCVPATYYNKQCKLDRYIIPRFGRTMIKDITPRMIDDWFLTLKNGNKELAGGTRNDVLSILREILDFAVVDGLIDQNPARNVEPVVRKCKKRPTISKEELDILFPKDTNQLIEIWGSVKYALYFSILKDTGFRPGEVLALTWDNVNFDNHSVFTTKSVSQFEGKVVDRIKTTNTGKKYKVGFLSEETMEILEYHRILSPNELLFLDRSGGVYNIADINRVFRRRVKTYLGRDDLTEYCLRHAFETNLIDKLPKEIITELMGHTKFNKVYDDSTSEQIINRLLKKLQN